MDSRIKIFIVGIFILVLYNLNLFSQPLGSTKMPKQEVRAVWITTVAGMDWPRTTNPDEQRGTLLEILDNIKNANFNTIFFQVRGRGDAMYRSNYEPWSERLTGILGRDPGWDPLEFVLVQAHARGIEVHAWFNTFRVRNGEKSAEGDKKHIADIYPDWAKKIEGETWIDPGIPEVREYTLKVAMDLVRNYDIDGIHFDFIRYPGKNYPDESTYRKFGEGENKDEWRRENVNKFVRAFYDSAISLKPMLKVGSAPIGVYRNIPNANGWQSYSEIFQDSRRWIREQKHDYLVPQVYWSLGNSPRDPDFATLAKDWAENSFGRHIYIGIGAYKPKVFEQLPLLIDVTRLYGSKGNSLFRYEHIKDNLSLSGRYLYPANIPPMPWKDDLSPNPPRDLQVNEVNSGIFQLKWRSSQIAKDGDAAKYYNVYRSAFNPVDINDPSNIIAIVKDTFYLDKISKPKSGHYYYVVTAFDKGNNESVPVAIQEVEIPIIAKLTEDASLKFNLTYLYRKSPNTIYITYELNKTGNVVLKITDNGDDDKHVIFSGIQPAGRYIYAVNPEKLKKGIATIQLKLEDESIYKSLYIYN